MTITTGVGEFEKGISELSLILRENIDYIEIQLEEIQLDNSYNIDFTGLIFLTGAGILGFISWIEVIQGFGILVTWITIFGFLGLLIGAYKMILIEKNALIKKVIKYTESKKVILQNTEDLSVELRKYMHTKNIDPKQIEDISRRILSYAKNMYELYESYLEICIQDSSSISEKKGFRRNIRSFLEYEEIGFKKIIDGFNMIFDFWIQTHISKIQSYQNQVQQIHSDNISNNNTLLLAVTRMDTNIKIFEKIQLIKN